MQIFVMLFPKMWKTFSVSTKILFTILVFTIITLYTVIVSWAAIRATTLDAANDWWHMNYREAHAESDKLRGDIINGLKDIKDITLENRDDIKFLNRTLIEQRTKNNP
jgi:hypothetical protein